MGLEKLTPAQACLLAELPLRTLVKYQPAAALVRLGLAEWSACDFGHGTISATAKGTAWITAAKKEPANDPAE